MRRLARSTVSTVLAAALLAAVPATAVAEAPDDTISATAPSDYDLPDGGTVVFNPTDPAGAGATVDVAALETSGATAETEDGTVTAIGDGVDVSATSPSGEDITSLQHEVTIIPGTEDEPPTDEVTPAIELTFPVSAEDLAGIDLATLGVYSRESASDPWTWVPSAYDADLGAVVAQSDHLSEFTVMGAPAAAPTPAVPKIALDPDDLIGKANWNGTVYNELQFSSAVASAVKTRLEDECSADVLITRNSSQPIVSRTTRANLISNFDADIAMTLAFNTYNTAPDGIARPWGIEADGGIVAWSANNAASRSLGNSIKSDIVTYTGRSDRRPLNPSNTNLPYSQLVGSAPAYAHAELLFLDHNFDWPVMSTHLDLVVDAVFSSIVKQIDATAGIACAEPVTLPDPPSQDVIDQLTQLGKNNYQTYGTDPVNLSTGNFVTSEKVFNVTGVGDQDMDLALAYNALDGRASQVGDGWNFGFGSRVQLFADGSYLATLADGRRVNFTPDGSGGYTASSGGQASLADTADGVVLTFSDRTILEFTVDEVTGYGELARAVDRQGNAYTLTYGPLADAADGDVVFPPLTSITDEAGQTVAVTSTAQGRITAFTHPDGRVWTLGYDGDGNLTSVKDGAGRTRSFAYNAEGLLSAVTGADGVQEVTNAYDDVDRVVTQTDGAGSVRAIAYGDNHSTTLTDALGNASTVDHNAKGQAVASHDAAGGVTFTGYDSNYNPTQSVDANGNVFNSTFDAFGKVLTTTTPLGEVTTYTYNGAGDLTSITTPDSNGGTSTTSFVLNSDGRAIETHLPDGAVTYATYDAHGDVTSTTDALGNVTTFEYDACGNAVTVTDALGGTTVNTYDLANRVTQSIDPLGNATAQTWDAADNLTSVTDALGQVTSYEYDANDSLVSQTDARGLVTTFEYNVNLQRTAINNPDGTRVTFDYDVEHHMVKQTNPDDTFRTWEYDALGRATAMVDESGARWVTIYDAIGNAVATIDPDGNRTETAYDPMGRATATTDALGNTSTVAFNAAGLTASSTDALGRATSYDYDSAGRLIGTSRPDGTTTSFTYDGNGLTTSATDARGFTTAYEYDALGRETAMVDALGGSTRTEYDATSNLTARIDALGARTEYAYDALSRRVSVTDALGGTLTTAYDPAGNVLASTDALGRVTEFTYDVMSRLTSTALPDGAVTRYGYNTMGDLVAVTDALGATIGYEYDPVGRETAKIDEAGERWTIEYDAVGNATAAVDPTGARTAMEYDALNRQVATTDALGNRTSNTLDAVGAVAVATDALGRTTSYDYDAMGRVASVALPDGTTNSFAYDAEGNAVDSTDGRGFTTAFEYDALGRQTAMVDALSGRSASEYDALGNLTASVDATGVRTTRAYDALSRLVSATDALGGTATTEYDAVGNAVKSTDALGHVTSATYDPMGRVTSSTLADGATTRYAYDALGHVLSVTDALGATVLHEYDPVGRETAKIDEAGGRWVTRYDAVGNATAAVDPTGARTTVEYDALGQQVASSDSLGNRTAQEFDAVGSVVGVTDALGQSTVYTYDAANRLTSVTTPQGATTEFGYDANGNGTSTRNALGDALTVEFDALNRPVAQVDPDGGRSVTTYDAAGRTLTATDPSGVTETYAYDAIGRLTSFTDGEGFATTSEYDAVGNVVSTSNPRGGVVTTTYDAVNRPVTVTDEVGATTTTTYDSVGRVSSTTDPAGVVKRFTYDPRGLLTATTENYVAGEESSASVNVTTSTAYDARGLATSITDPRGNVTTYSRDAMGRVTDETDANGGTTSTQFDALGRPTVATATDGSVAETTYTPDGYVAAVVRQDQTVTYTYDAVGHRLTMEDELGTSSWAYDWAGRVVSETDARGNTTTHEYDVAGNLAGIEYADGRTVERSFDARGLTVSQTDTSAAGVASVTTFEYDQMGAMTGQVRASGVTSKIDRDLAGRVTGMTYTGLGVTQSALPSGAVNPSSAAPGNAYGHCKDNGNGHPNQQPAGCSTETLAFAYVYDERGFVAQRDVMSDEATTHTTYSHDALGRLTRSVSSGASTLYLWDAASNLVGEAGTDDPATAKTGDEYAIARTVNDVNELVSSVKTPVGTPGGKVETTAFSYDGRGNRTGSVTTMQTGKKTHTVASSAFVYDSMDQLTSTTGPEGSVLWVRDGVGRALSVTEDGVVSNRLFDGFTVVADGDTQVVTGPDGLVLGETTTTVTTRGKNTSTSVTSVDVLTDVLGSAVGTASGGVISADLHLFGDFGESLTTPKVDTVTGFTGKVSTAGLVEFASRTYDPATRVWLQDDRFRGTTTRASSLNRYAYVEGAPESFVDVLGFYRAAAAIQAQQLAAAQAAYDAELKALKAARGEYLTQSVSIPGMGSLPRYVAQGLFRTDADFEAYIARYNRGIEARNQEAQRKYQELRRIQLEHEAGMAQIQAEYDGLLFYHTVNATVDVLSDPSTATHLVLDVVGMIPVVGEAADGLNALIYLAEGDKLNAAISAAGMLPIGGQVATGARAIRKALGAGVDAVKAMDATSSLARVAKIEPPTPSSTASALTPPTASPAALTPAALKPAGPVPGAQAVPSGSVAKVENPYPRGSEPYKNAPSPNQETVIGPYAPGKSYDYVDVAGARGSSHFDMGTDWDPLSGPVANTKYIDDVIARQDTVHSTVSVSRLYELRDAAIRRGEAPPGDSLLAEWELLEGAGYTWTGPNTLSPPGA